MDLLQTNILFIILYLPNDRILLTKGHNIYKINPITEIQNTGYTTGNINI